MLKNLFFLFFVACLGLFFWRGYRRVFSRTPYRHSLWSFLMEECDPGQRRAVLRSLLAELPGDSSAAAWMLTLTALFLGGAGVLFWYLVFSLLWLHPMSALAGLYHYYCPGKGSRVRADVLLSEMLRRKKARPRPALGRLIQWLQTLALCGMLPLLLQNLSVSAAPVRGTGLLLCMAGLILVWLLCRRLGERGEIGLGVLFLLVVAAALLDNLSNLIPVMELVVMDAFDQNRFIFALSGAGLAAALQFGGAAGCGGALLRTLTPGERQLPLSHPIQFAFYDRMRGLVQVTVQVILGELFLCARLVPQDNRWPQACLWLLLTLFGLVWLARATAVLARKGERHRSLLCLILVGGAAAFDRFWGVSQLSGLSGGAAVFASLGLAGLLLLDSNWYFLLLEHYRDTHIWHTTPHPDLLRTGRDG